MENAFGITGGMEHYQTVDGISEGQYHYYVRCKNTFEETNDDDYLINFTVKGSVKENLEQGTDSTAIDDNEKALNLHGVKYFSTEDSIILTYKTDYKSKSVIKYGKSKDIKKKKKDDSKKKDHEFILQNLSPDNKYYFKINVKDGEGNHDESKTYSIRTTRKKSYYNNYGSDFLVGNLKNNPVDDSEIVGDGAEMEIFKNRYQNKDEVIDLYEEKDPNDLISIPEAERKISWREPATWFFGIKNLIRSFLAKR